MTHPLVIRETGVTIDHELGEVRVDTSHTPTARLLTKLGFVDVTPKWEVAYRRFVGRPEQVQFRKGKRVASPRQVAHLQGISPRKKSTQMSKKEG